MRITHTVAFLTHGIRVVQLRQLGCYTSSVEYYAQPTPQNHSNTLYPHTPVRRPGASVALPPFAGTPTPALGDHMPAELDDEVPADDFDKAYDWFSSQYADPRGDPPLLTERESRVFSQFLDTIVRDPGSHTDPARFLDNDLFQRLRTRSELAGQAGESMFYRGFVDPRSPPPPDQSKTTSTSSDSIHGNIRDSARGNIHGDLHEDTRGGSSGDTRDSRGGASESDHPHEDAEDEAMLRRREFLTEDQVRQNHIVSEKKRRDAIKQLFNEMGTLVPAIRDADEPLSKAVVLQFVHAHILHMATENRRLRNILKDHDVDTSAIEGHSDNVELP